MFSQSYHSTVPTLSVFKMQRNAQNRVYYFQKTVAPKGRSKTTGVVWHTAISARGTACSAHSPVTP